MSAARGKTHAPSPSRRGASLVEALAALAVLSLAVAGAGGSLRASLAALGEARLEAGAASALRALLEAGESGEGALVLPGGAEASWRVSEETLGAGGLAGVRVRYVRREASLEWTGRTGARRLAAARVRAVADARA